MRKTTLKRALDTYGVDMQQIVAMEELAELQKEISKHLRGADNLDHMAEEIADVKIMLEQLMMAFRLRDPVETWVTRKMARLSDRLGESDVTP